MKNKITHFQVMSNTGDHFPDNLNPSPELSVLEPPQQSSQNTDGPLLTSSPVAAETDTVLVEDVNEDRENDKNDEDEINPKISPIVSRRFADESFVGTSAHLQPINEEDDEYSLKRKRDSFDNVSLASIDSLAPSVLSAKKPKLTRTGSISRTLKRSMSFMTPISSIFRPNRTSVDPNASISSITSVESTTLNESIRRPMKEMFKGMKERITRSSKKDFSQTPKSSKIERFGQKDSCQDADETVDFVTNSTMMEADETTCGGFKTPIAPSKSHSTIGRHSVCGTPTDYSTASRCDINNARKSLIQATSSVATSSTIPVFFFT